MATAAGGAGGCREGELSFSTEAFCTLHSALCILSFSNDSFLRGVHTQENMKLQEDIKLLQTQAVAAQKVSDMALEGAVSDATQDAVRWRQKYQVCPSTPVHQSTNLHMNMASPLSPIQEAAVRAKD